MGDTVEALGYKANVPGRVRDAVHDRVHAVRGTIDDVLGSLLARMDDLGSAREAAQERLRATGMRVTATMSDTLHSARENAGALRERMPALPAMPTMPAMPSPGEAVHVAARNPLALALGGLAAGFLAGLITPVSDYERRRVRPLRDNLLDRAHTIGGDVVQHGRVVLQDATRTAIDTAQQRAIAHAGAVLDTGLNDRGRLASSVMEHGRAVIGETARAVAQSAQASARRHGRDVLDEARGRTTHERSLRRDRLLDDMNPG